MSFTTRALLLITILFLSLAGCGQGKPSLYPIKGKITLAGEPYERLIVYFRPIEKEVTEFNLGVGETDAEGNLSMRSTAGNGLAAGTYKVTFTCLTYGESSIGLSDEKNDDEPMMATPEERVPELYTDQGDSPIQFEIKNSQSNFFEFDIPAKK